MVAASAADTLSPRAAELLSWVRAHKSIFSPGEGFTATHLALYRKNDTGRCLVPADELDCNAEMLPGVDVARSILENNEAILEKAKADVLAVAPELKDEESPVTKIFWHDLAYFLRVVSYGVAVTSPDYIHANNLGMVKQLYGEIGLSQAAVDAGITSLKSSVVVDVSDAELKKSTAECFDVLANFMQS